MAKKQSFGDKVLKRRQQQKMMARLVVSEKKPNGHIRFREKMIPRGEVQQALQAMR